MIVALAGHVDHGKTSIVRALTGVDTDRLAEEKRRGLTIDLGFAYADIGPRRVGFVDVPGHHRFVHNMVAGIAGRQYALLVVAADDGVMPQTREHLQILKLLGLNGGVVVLNKVDRVDAARRAAVRRDIRAATADSFLADANILDVSCASGDGIVALRDHLANLSAAPTDDSDATAFRLAIDRAFNVRGSGLVVTGTVVSGAVAVEDRAALGGSGKTVRVRGLHVQDAEARSARAGDRVAVNLTGANIDEVTRGEWLVDPQMHCPSERFAVALTVLDDFPRPLKHNAPVHVYHATSHSQGRVLLIDGAALAPGGHAIVDLVTQRPLQPKIGDRIVLRDHDLGRTVGGGRILEVAAPLRRRTSARRDHLASIRPDDAGATLDTLARRQPVDVATFAQHWNLPANAVEALAADADLRRSNGQLLHPDLIAETIADIRAQLDAHHREHPASDGLTSRQIGSGNNAEARTQAVLALLVDDGSLRLDKGHYALATHRASIPDDVLRLFAAVETSLDSTQPPSLGDIGKRLRRPFAALERDMRALPAFGLAVRISDNRFYLPQRLLELAAVAADLAARAPFTVRQFRDASGVGRNIVIEVLEHFDAKGFTRRNGDTRQVIGEPTAVVAS